MDLSDLRHDYCKFGLTRELLDDNPFKQFDKWFKEAQNCKVDEPNAMQIATVNANGEPSLRTVLLKAYDEDGFVFFTNYESQKAHDLGENPHICANFLWLFLERQVRISGVAEKISTARSLKYFLSRPFSSRLGAWVSNQSHIITSRKILEMKFDEMKRKFADGKVPLPDHWGGYVIKPASFEFWQGRPSRLHDRFKYHDFKDGKWEISRLAP